MKQFFGAFFGSIIGLLITGIVVILIAVASIMTAIKDEINMDGDKSYTAKENSILRLDLNGEIKERGFKNPLGSIDLGPLMPKTSLGLDDIIANLKKAKADNMPADLFLAPPCTI